MSSERTEAGLPPPTYGANAAGVTACNPNPAPALSSVEMVVEEASLVVKVAAGAGAVARPIVAG